MRALLVHQGIEEVLEDPRTSKKISKVKDKDIQETMDKAHSIIILSLRDGVLREDVKEALSSKESSKKSKTRDGEGLTEGHFKRDFPERKIKHKDANNRNGNAVIASEDSDEGYDYVGVLVASNMQTEGGKVLMGNNVSCKVIGIGSVRLKMSDGIIRELDNVRHIPELKRNLISLSMLDKAGCCIRLESSSLKVIKGSLIMMKGVMQLGHVSESGLKELEKQGALGSDKISTVGFCEECVLRKSSRTRFKTAVHNTKGTLDYIHSDLWGPAQIESLGGACYFLSMINDFSRMVWVYPLRSKDQVFDRFKAWKTLIETQTNRKVRRIRTDNGLKFCNKQFDDLCEKTGILRHKTVMHTPQQNGLAERMNRTLMERVRCMLFHSKLPKTLWVEALSTTCYLINRCPSTAIELKTPYEVWSGKLADYTKLRIFGCTVYAHIKQGKLEPRALKCAFLGYPSGTKGYKLWCVDLKPPKCIISRDVIFNESEMLKSQTSAQSTIQKIPRAETPHFEVELTKTEDGQNTSHTGETQGSDGTSAQSPEHTSIQDYQLTRDKQKRQVRAPERLGYADLIAYALTASQEVDQEEPKTYEEAVASKESAQWIKAMEDEMDSLNKNGTWKLIQKPEGRKVVGCKWVYKIKDGIPNVEPKRFKARKTYGEEVIYLVLYVDDMFLDSKSMKLIDLLKQQLRDKFDMKDLGPAKKILGVEMIRNRTTRTLFLSQEKYVNKVLEKFGMLNCKPVSTPMAAHFRLSSQQCPSTESEQTEMLKTPYASSVGCLMYAMVLTRPDLSYAVSLVSRFMSNPGKEHWRAVKWILRYLRGTTSYGLLYGGERANYNLVEGFVDSDYAGDLDNRRSLTGFLFTLNSCTISWKASLQSVVALSTTEAEYTAAAEAFKEAIWLRGMINELGYEQSSITILCDSQSAISLSKN
ncbi:hypothetical protein WN943_028956 [Citrus x changshan-huyou]